MSAISHNPVEYNTFLAILECELIDNYSNLDIARGFKLDVEYNDDRTILYNNNTVIQKATPICSTRSKNKLNPEKDGVGFVKISLPSSKTAMEYTNPTELIYIGAYCICCKMNGPNSHTETCIRPRKSSLYLTLYGLIESIPKYANCTIEEISQKICISDLDKFKYTKDKNTEQPINKSVKESIVKFFSDLIDKNDCIEYGILEEEDKCQPLIPETKTTISISTLISLPSRDQKEYLPGPIMIKYKNNDGVGVTIRVRVKKQELRIEILSNPYSEKYLYRTILDRINKSVDKVLIRKTDIKSCLAKRALFTDKSKQLNSKKIMELIWPENRLKIGNYSYIYLSGKKMYRYTAKSGYEMHEDRICLELIDTSKDSTGVITSGPIKMHIQLFEQGHFQITFTYCNPSDDKDTITLTEFRQTDKQFEHIEKTIKRVSDEFVDFLIKLDNEYGITLNKQVEKTVSKKTEDTISGSMPYTKRKRFYRNDVVQIFDYDTMTWSVDTCTITEVVESKVDNRLYKIEDQRGKEREIRHTK